MKINWRQTKGNGGEERRHMQHRSEWSGDRKCEGNEIPGSHVGEEGSCDAEVDHRIGAASKVSYLEP